MSTELTPPSANVARSVAGKYLTFVLGHESYGVAVPRVREIIRLTSITAVPRMPSHVKGVINLRGKIIPVVDLRIRFGLGQAETTEQTCIVVVQTVGPNGTKPLMGLIVDAVEEVINITAAEIEEPPDFGKAVDTAYILGMAKVKRAVKALLDIDRVVKGDAIQTG